METSVKEDSWMGKLIRAYEKILKPDYDVSTLDKANNIICDALDKLERLIKTEKLSTS